MNKLPSNHIFSSSPENEILSIPKTLIAEARKGDLYTYLCLNHENMFNKVGCCLETISNPSLYIRKNFPGYHDFATGEHGNSIDFLVKHLDYSFQDAVFALTGNGLCTTTSLSNVSKPMKLPEMDSPPFKRLYAYLMSRGIPSSVITDLIRKNLLYQEKIHGNIVFVNPEKNYCELRGTFSQRPFHGCLKSSPDNYWYFSSSSVLPKSAFICEAAIDAVSLFLLHRTYHPEINAVYISIGGVSNDKSIIAAGKRFNAVLAVDNDEAGEKCRLKHNDMPSAIPKNKDWNEDLLALNRSS